MGALLLVNTPQVQRLTCVLSTCHQISTGAGIFVNIADGTTNVVFPNNGIVIARNSGGDRFNFQCRSGSTGTDVGDIIGLDGNALPIDSTGAGVTTGGLNVRRASPATVLVRNRAGTEPALTAAEAGVYTCRIPDESGTMVDVNIGVYQNGFNSESVHLPVMLYSIGSMYAHLLALISCLLNVRTNLIKPRKDNDLSWPSNLCQACICIL